MLLNFKKFLLLVAVLLGTPAIASAGWYDSGAGQTLYDGGWPAPLLCYFNGDTPCINNVNNASVSKIRYGFFGASQGTDPSNGYGQYFTASSTGGRHTAIWVRPTKSGANILPTLTVEDINQEYQSTGVLFDYWNGYNYGNSDSAAISAADESWDPRVVTVANPSTGQNSVTIPLNTGIRLEWACQPYQINQISDYFFPSNWLYDHRIRLFDSVITTNISGNPTSPSGSVIMTPPLGATTYSVQCKASARSVNSRSRGCGWVHVEPSGSDGNPYDYYSCAVSLPSVNTYPQKNGPVMSVTVNVVNSLPPTVSISADTTNILVGQSSTITATFVPATGDTLTKTAINGPAPVPVPGGYTWTLAPGLSWNVPADIVTYLTSSVGTCGTNCWTVPSTWDSTRNTIEVIGGGGGGAAGSDIGKAGGGGGGYSKISNLALTPGATVRYVIGAGGGVSGTGGDTYFCNSTSNCSSISGSAVRVGAKGGVGGSGTTGGAGGASSAGVGTTKYSGGKGGNGAQWAGAGGGGAAGPYGAGGNGGVSGSGSGGGGGGAGGGNNGAAGNTSTGGSNYLGAGGGGVGSAGTNGGGGGGGVAGTPPGAGGAGGAGQEWDSTHGSGGGGGGRGDQPGSSATSINSGSGGLYGGGGAGTGADPGGNPGSGAQGIIVIKNIFSTTKTYTFTPSQPGTYRFMPAAQTAGLGTTWTDGGQYVDIVVTSPDQCTNVEFPGNQATVPANATQSGTTCTCDSGYVPSGGGCVAAPPPAIGTFTASPERVRSGLNTTLTWTGSNLPAACTLSSTPTVAGLPLSVSSSPTGGTAADVGPITQTTIFTLTCTTATNQVTVGTVPVFREI